MTTRFDTLSTLDLHALAESLWDDIQALPIDMPDEQAALWDEYHEVEAEIDRRRGESK